MNELSAPKVNICGTGISNISFKEMISIFNSWITTGAKKRVCVTPVNCIVWAADNKNLQNIYNSADLTLCDGVPLIWLSKILGNKIKERITGLDVLPIYLEECYRNNFSIFFLGAKEGVAETLKAKYEKQFPGIRIVGTYSPPFASTFSDAENEKMIGLVNAVKPNILWVSLTAPKQDYWIYENLHRLDTNIAIGVGGAFEVAAGMIERAPAFMQRSGLEWFYRFSKEPKRLFKRYFIEAPRIFPLLVKQLIKGKSKKDQATS
jgi:N-acetylglucosaminyldiphosphoundecaprenol N-acetyl-beta-D-mannosaminyltransferase